MKMMFLFAAGFSAFVAALNFKGSWLDASNVMLAVVNLALFLDYPD